MVLGKAPFGKGSFQALGPVDSKNENVLSYCTSERYIEKINNNPNISGVITKKKFTDSLKGDLAKIFSEEPRYDFFKLYNHIYSSNYQKKKTNISHSAFVHPTAFVSEFNVTIGEHVNIGPNATILPDVIIGDNCTIQANSVLGVDDFEVAVSKKGILNLFHNGRVVLKNSIQVGANTTIAKGIYGKDTLIGEKSIISNHCHIGHSAEIGKCCLILNCTICGTTCIGDFVRVSPGAIVSNNISIGDNAHVSIGAVVVKDIANDTTVSGNFAVEHNRFLYKHIKTYGNL